MVGARRRRRREGYGRRSSSRTSSPYLRSFESPTPDTRRRSEGFVGCDTAIAARVESWNTTYAGTPAARAVSERHRRRRSMVAAGASAPFAVRCFRLAVSVGSVSGGVVPLDIASRPAGVSSTTGYSPELWRASPAATTSASSCLTRSSFHLFNAPWKGRSWTQAWAVDHFVFRPPSTAATLASPTRPLNLAMAARLALTAAAGIGSSGGRSARQLSHALHRRATPCSPK